MKFSRLQSSITRYVDYFHFFFFFIMAAPVACGSLWATGGIGAAAVAYTTAMATLDPSHICDLCRSLLQCRILNPLSKARDRNCILAETTLGP